jgi:hypothetical protein
VVLKPQDLLVAIRLALMPAGALLNYTEASTALGLSRTEVHAAVRRCVSARLAGELVHRADAAVEVNRGNLLEFLLHGVRFAFPPTLGGVTRGVPTAHAAPALAGRFAPSDLLPPVWPHPEGNTRGRAFEPLYRSVPVAAAADPRMYAALALVDAIRGGSARDRRVAAPLLEAMLAPSSPGGST